MVREEIKKSPVIRRKAEVPKSNRTSAREEAARWIVKNVLEEGKWPGVTIKEIAEESGWSRQHIANTLEYYFDPAEDSSTATRDAVDIDFDTLLQVYRRGYREGYEDAQEQQTLEAPDSKIEDRLGNLFNQ